MTDPVEKIQELIEEQYELVVARDGEPVICWPTNETGDDEDWHLLDERATGDIDDWWEVHVKGPPEVGERIVHFLQLAIEIGLVDVRSHDQVERERWEAPHAELRKQIRSAEHTIGMVEHEIERLETLTLRSKETLQQAQDRRAELRAKLKPS